MGETEEQVEFFVGSGLIKKFDGAADKLDGEELGCALRGKREDRGPDILRLYDWMARGGIQGRLSDLKQGS